eukprot:12904947-Prorocentrum_lima.AAC.1
MAEAQGFTTRETQQHSYTFDAAFHHPSYYTPPLTGCFIYPTLLISLPSAYLPSLITAVHQQD